MKKLRTDVTRFLIVVAALICGYFTLTTGRAAGANSMKNGARPTADLRVAAAIRHLEQTGLYNSLSAAVTAARYQIEARKEGGHEAANPKQGYRTVFTREGVEVRGSGRTGDKWRLGMKLTAYGYGERKNAAPAADVKAKDDRIEYERRASAGGAISEWYVNRASGLEQGFTIPEAPGTRRAGEKLNLWLKLSGDLKARLDESGQAILLNGRGAGAGLRYDNLHAFDATGREIEARMNLAGDQVRIEVSDEGAIYPVMIDPTLTQQQKLEAADGVAGDNFGDCVAISGETVVVGAPFDDDAAGADQGSAYVFVRSGGVWSQQQKLLASDARAGALFGADVAIDGDTAIIGAPGNVAGAIQGSAYVFVRSGGVWSQQQKLEAAEAVGPNLFGLSVAISGETVVVGAQLDDGAAGVDQGSAYVFARSGGVWSRQQKLLASDARAGALFGRWVAISGETVVASAIGQDPGSAYVFVRSGGVWSQQQKLLPPDPGVIDLFGWSVAISGETVVVGAIVDDGAAGVDQGSAYVFVRSGGVWTPQQKLLAPDPGAGDQFGVSVRISGETVVIGALLHDGAAGVDQGSAYVFARSGGFWTPQQKLEASDAGAGDQFGVSVAISGETVAVSARFDDGAAGADQGSAYVFAPANQPPTISAVANSRRQGVPASASTIATVSDPDQSAGSLTVTVNGGSSATVNGVTVSGLTNSDGVISATIGASCAATDATFTLTVTDNASATATATLDVTVTANTPPTLGSYPNTGPIAAGSGATITPSSPPADNVSVSSVMVTASAGFTGSLNVDPATGVVTVANAGPPGAWVITVTATDNCGATASGQFTLTVIPANQPPNCSGAFPSVVTIWPPTHDMVNVTIQGVTDPDGDPVTITIDRIKQDEPIDGAGDGHTCPDGAGIGTSTAQVRAERSAQGNGRVYTIFFTASDGKGGSCQGSVTVCVPKSRNGSCRANFDSTACATSLK